VVEVPITEQMLAYVKEGQPVRITAPALGQTPLEATLSRISPFLAPGSFSTVGEIDLGNDQGRLRPGMFVAVDILHGESERATLVPASALWEEPASGVRGLFVVEDAPAGKAGAAEPEARVSWRPVEVAAQGRATVGVRGVPEGAWVVTVGQHLLSSRNAPKVRVRRVDWQRVLTLQSLQQEDLLAGYLAKQERMARTLGARPPRSDDIVGGEAAPAAPASDARPR
jgi:hypothetical protein